MSTQRYQKRRDSSRVGKSRPHIDAGNQDLESLTNAAIEALLESNDPPVLFRQDGRIVWVLEADDGGPRIQEVTLDRMIHRLARVAVWFREKN